MAPKLTDEQRSAVEQQGGRPIEVVDAATERTYYLISSDQFNQIRALLESEPFDVSQTYAAQSAALSSIWNDPQLDAYNDTETPPNP